MDAPEIKNPTPSISVKHKQKITMSPIMTPKKIVWAPALSRENSLKNNYIKKI